MFGSAVLVEEKAIAADAHYLGSNESNAEIYEIVKMYERSRPRRGTPSNPEISTLLHAPRAVPSTAYLQSCSYKVMEDAFSRVPYCAVSSTLRSRAVLLPTRHNVD